MSIAMQVQSFLITFQTDVLLGPFPYSKLLSMVKSLQAQYVKHSVLDSKRDTLKIDLEQQQLEHLHQDRHWLQCWEVSEVSHRCKESQCDKQSLEFCMECRAFLVGVVQKILSKFPLNYSLAKTLAAFNSWRMADCSYREVIRTHLKGILKHMIEAGRILRLMQMLCHSSTQLS